LKLPTFLREYDKLARLCAAEGVDHPRYLMRLMIDRERRTVERRIKAARFPTVKSLDSFDFLALPSPNKMLVLELARSDCIERRENIIAVNNSGTGKSPWRPIRRVYRLALSRRRLWSTSCSKRVTKSGYCVFSVSSPATSC
jgi:hypothetical protein